MPKTPTIYDDLTAWLSYYEQHGQCASEHASEYIKTRAAELIAIILARKSCALAHDHLAEPDECVFHN